MPIKDCDIVNYGIDAIVTEADEKEAATDAWLDENIQIDPEHKAVQNTKFFRKLIKVGSKFSRGIDLAKVRKDFGELTEREFISGQIYSVLGANPQLAEAIVEDMFLEVTAMDLKLKKNVFEDDPITGQKKLHLYRLPVRPLTRLLNSANQWAAADPSKLDNMMYRMVWLPWGTTRKMRYNDNSGAYNKVWKATQNFPDRQGAHIEKFMDPEQGVGTKVVSMPSKKEKGKIIKKERPLRTLDVAKGMHGGMEGILSAVQRLYTNIPNTDLRRWLAPGFYKGRSKVHAEANLMELFTWIMHGRIENITEERAAKKDQEGNLIYEHGPQLYIYSQRAPTQHTHETTGDVVFGWQKPVPLRYDKEIHGSEGIDPVTGKEGKPKVTDQRGRLRYDTLRLIQNSIPITEKIFASLNKLALEARPIIDEAYVHFNVQTEKSFQSVLDALIESFPGKNKDQLSDAFIKGKFSANWTKADRAKFTLFEENFTKWSLQKPFKPTISFAEYQQNYYPYIFMPEIYTLLLEDAVDTLDVSIEKVEDAYRIAKGAKKNQLGTQLAGLRASLANQQDMKEQMLEMHRDEVDGDKMTTRIQSQHFKHVSNAFDVLKSRTDSSVFRDSLTHTARTVEMNYLTAELIKALNMTDSKPSRDAFISLYRGALGRADARSLFAGINVADVNLNPKVVRTLKAIRKWWNLMLAKPTTAMRQYFGMIEKYNKMGTINTLEAWDVYKSDLKELEPLIKESGIVIFNDFFTNAIVSELETLEAERDTINAMATAYVNFFLKSDTIGTDKAAKELKDKLTKLFGRKMKWENVLTAEEAKKFDKKLKAEKLQRITNKITNWAISNQNTIREVFRQNNITKPAAIGLDIVTGLRGLFGPAFVMDKAERVLRITSFILGVQMSQRAGLIQPGPIHELTGNSRKLAIEYGRKATNLMFDFSMSRQGVGESYRSALGSIGGQFSVWKSQKAASDIDLWNHLKSAFNNDATPLSILRVLKDISKSDKHLELTNPDALKFKRWFKGQFLLEGLIQVSMVSSYLPFVVGEKAASVFRYAFYATGARNLSAAGSPIAGLVWGGIIGLYMMFMKGFGEDPWDDEKDLERFISHQFRNIPGVGVGEGLLYDGTELLLLMMLEKEILAKEHALGMSNYIFPLGGRGAIKGLEKVIEVIQE